MDRIQYRMVAVLNGTKKQFPEELLRLFNPADWQFNFLI